MILISLLLGLIQPVKALNLEDCANKSEVDKARCLTDLTLELEAKIKEARGQQKTLAGTIAYLDNNINLTRASIEKTEHELKILEEEIATLAVKISRLDTDLDAISKLLVSRIGASYKRSLFKPIYMVFATGGLSDFFERNKYLQSVQQNDRVVLLELQNSKDLHEEQKKAKEAKQTDAETLRQKLAAQKTALDRQKSSKQELLDLTKNNEAKYQSLIAAARAEYAAIQNIIAGKGVETKVRHVDEGKEIASIMKWSEWKSGLYSGSCNSSGAHIHFMATINGVTQNPFNYLNNNIDHANCSGPGECSAADPFNPGGNWPWPINPKVRFSQGYGATWAVQNTWVSQIYNFHNGIDINSESSSSVKAVKNGDLYQGSYLGGCNLTYVRLDHDDSDVDTYYLHVNYY